MAKAVQDSSQLPSPQRQILCPASASDGDYVSQLSLPTSVQAVSGQQASSAVVHSTLALQHVVYTGSLHSSLLLHDENNYINGYGTETLVQDSFVPFTGPDTTALVPDCYPDLCPANCPFSVDESQEGVDGRSSLVVSNQGFLFNYNQLLMAQTQEISESAVEHIDIETTSQSAPPVNHGLVENQPVNHRPVDPPVNHGLVENQPDPPVHTCTGELQLKTVTNNNGSFVWKIPDIARRKRDAMNGTTKCLYSPYFTTCGHKVCLRLYLNGDGTGKDTHISLYIDWENKPLNLRWPQLSLTLINQSKQRDHQQSLLHDLSEMNIASGFPQFARQTMLESNYSFLHDDCICIKFSS